MVTVLCVYTTTTHESERNMSIEVEIKNVYGNATIYPVNAAAKTFAQIAGTKTLKRDTIALAKTLGYTVTVIVPAVAL